jgi:hypothetical protein
MGGGDDEIMPFVYRCEHEVVDEAHLARAA